MAAMPKSNWKRSHQSSGSEASFFLKITLWQVSCRCGRDFEDISIIRGCYLVQGNSQVCAQHNFLLSAIRYCPTSYKSKRSPENWTLWVKAVEEDRGWPHRCQLSFEISIREETPWVLLLPFASIHIFPIDSQARDVTSSKSFLLEKRE